MASWLDEMSVKELKNLLEHLEDTREIVLRRAGGDELVSVWRAARSEANAAFDAWRRSPGVEAYAAYRAAEDRADAAEASLVASCRSRQEVAT